MAGSPRYQIRVDDVVSVIDGKTDDSWHHWLGESILIIVSTMVCGSGFPCWSLTDLILYPPSKVNLAKIDLRRSSYLGARLGAAKRWRSVHRVRNGFDRVVPRCNSECVVIRCSSRSWRPRTGFGLRRQD